MNPPKVDDDASLSNLDALTPDQVSRLDHGVVQLDSRGRVVEYNASARAMVGISDGDRGRHFFRDVVPSANVPAFHGRFLSGVRRGRIDENFRFVFGGRLSPVNARIGLSQAASSDRWWLEMIPLEHQTERAERKDVITAVDLRVRAEPLDPSVCEREPIHIPGAIQSNAVTLIADAESLVIVGHSANVDEIGLNGETIEGQTIEGVLPPAFVSDLRAACLSGECRDGKLVSRTITLPGGVETNFYAVAHVNAGRLIVELERAPDHPADFASASSIDLLAALARLRGAADVEDAALIITRDIRALTGFDAVMVYRFDDQWNGEAIAEDMVSDWDRSLLGLRFPASDIPAQARALYHKAKSRFVIDRDAVPVPLVAGRTAGNAPIDLSFAENRTLSPIHLEYQRNLGVNGSMSLSILVEDRLWGLMIGHHRQPHYVAPESRAAASTLADAFAMRVEEIEARSRWKEQQTHLDIENALVRRLAGSEDVVSALTTGTPTLLDLFDATGAAIVVGRSLSRIGSCPDGHEVLALADWLRVALPPGQAAFASSALGSVYAPACAFADQASGLLAVFVDAGREHLLLWFKPEVASTVTWSGNPTKPILPGTNEGVVLPRRSFERWVEERRGNASDWEPWQPRFAEQLALAVEGVVLRQRRKIDALTELVAEKDELIAQKDLLTKEIDHRVKNSLQIVSAFLHMQQRRLTDPVAKQAFSDTTARVMSVARVHDRLYQTDAPEQVDLGQTLDALCGDLLTMAGSADTVSLKAEPKVMVPYQKAVALCLIATELVTNALKYATKPGKGVAVSVSLSREPDGVRMRVCDDGDGLPEGWKINKPVGTGLGMRLIRSMLDQIEATLTAENAPGACFTVRA